MEGQDGTCAIVDLCLDPLRINGECLGICIGKYGECLLVKNHDISGNEGYGDTITSSPASTTCLFAVLPASAPRYLGPRWATWSNLQF